MNILQIIKDLETITDYYYFYLREMAIINDQKDMAEAIDRRITILKSAIRELKIDSKNIQKHLKNGIIKKGDKQ